jgi:hypothetical protein
MIVKFSPVIALKTLDGQMKLCKNILMKFMNSRSNIRFEAQRKSLSIMGIIINSNQIIFEACNALNR